ncbi:hypothetical protein BaRGS_00002210 [Batillaria attramentaria]|uniref:Uncharacterized protein n=1 Tax=Batillaria attramentaria TaxID=370345 RepID=A0ABD0M493_9CAEN
MQRKCPLICFDILDYTVTKKACNTHKEQNYGECFICSEVFRVILLPLLHASACALYKNGQTFVFEARTSIVFVCLHGDRLRGGERCFKWLIIDELCPSCQKIAYSLVADRPVNQQTWLKPYNSRWWTLKGN